MDWTGKKENKNLRVYGGMWVHRKQLVVAWTADPFCKEEIIGIRAGTPQERAVDCLK
jgi:hypothetical protein